MRTNPSTRRQQIIGARAIFGGLVILCGLLWGWKVGLALFAILLIISGFFNYYNIGDRND